MQYAIKEARLKSSLQREGIAILRGDELDWRIDPNVVPLDGAQTAHQSGTRFQLNDRQIIGNDVLKLLGRNVNACITIDGSVSRDLYFDGGNDLRTGRADINIIEIHFIASRTSPNRDLHQPLLFKI